MHERILLIEDEEKIARLIEMELCYEGYSVTKAFDGREGLELALNKNFDLIILDILLPGLNGMEILRRIRKVSDIPIIMLTARDGVIDKVTGLDGGADDYMTKPFETPELLARIRGILRKRNAKRLAAGGLIVDVDKYLASFEGTPIDLTKREFDLLCFLLENKGIVQRRDVLLDKVWGFDYVGETNVVDVYIKYLRSKIDEVFDVKLIHTVRGVGYVIKDE